jgi:hypothetical protein
MEEPSTQRSAVRPREIRELIRQISLANPRWGAPRIHGELLKLESTLAKPPSLRTWCALAHLEEVSEKPHARYGLDRLLRRANRDLPAAVRLSHALP